MILMEFVLMSLICILLQLVTNFQGKNLAVVENSVAGISKKFILNFSLNTSFLQIILLIDVNGVNLQ